MIKDFEFYHGVVLSKLIHGTNEQVSIKAYPSASNASYILNECVGLFVKHSTKRMSPWRFSFQKVHQEEMLEMRNNLKEVFLILVCGDDGVVTLSFDEVKKILDDSHEQVEWISAARNPRKEYTIKGSDGSLGKKVGKSDFPRNVLSKCEKQLN